MILLGGAFGEGFAFYSKLEKILKVTPKGLFAKEISIPIGDVDEIQPMGMDSKKKVGETASLAATGLVVGAALGPLAALAGLAMGALAGGKRSEIVFGVVLKNDDALLIRASAAEFGEIQSELSSSRPSTSFKPKPRKTKKSQAQPKQIGETPELKMKKGRNTKDAPPPISGLALSIMDQSAEIRIKSDSHSQEITGEDILDNNMVLLILDKHIIEFNNTKWRYTDELINDFDVKELICLVAAYKKHFEPFFRKMATRSQETSDKLKNKAQSLREEASFINKKAKEKEALNFDAKSREADNDAISMLKKAENSAREVPLYEEFAKTYVSEEYLSEILEKYSKEKLSVINVNTYLDIISKTKNDSATKIVSSVDLTDKTELIKQKESYSDQDIGARLKNLKDLKEEGLITDDEYAKQRMVIISEI